MLGRAVPAAVAGLVLVAAWWTIGMLATDAGRYVGEPIVVETSTAPTQPPSAPAAPPARDSTPAPTGVPADAALYGSLGDDDAAADDRPEAE